MAGTGIAYGTPLAVAGYHVLRAMASDVKPADALTFSAVVILLLVVVAVFDIWTNEASYHNRCTRSTGD